MTQDKIIALAREAGAIKRYWGEGKEGFTFHTNEQIERFAALVAANLFTYDQVKAHIQAAVITEREACCSGDVVNAADIGGADHPHQVVAKYQAAIRARGEK